MLIGIRIVKDSEKQLNFLRPGYWSNYKQIFPGLFLLDFLLRNKKKKKKQELHSSHAVLY